MPVLADFELLVGNTPVTIGDPPFGKRWEKTFSTVGRHVGSYALLIFNVRGLTYTNEDVPVIINKKTVGMIFRYGGLDTAARTENGNYWYTQLITLHGNEINDGSNTIAIEAANWSGAAAGRLYDDFELKDMFCFYQKAA